MRTPIFNFFKRQTKLVNELETNIEDYLSWYKKTILKDLPENRQNYYIENLKSFIDKMAAWYELRFPDSTISNSSSQEINQIMFDSSEIKESWEDFFNTKKFVNALPHQEKTFLQKPKYPSCVYIDEKQSPSRLFLTSKGRVILAKGIYFIKKDKPIYAIDETGALREVKTKTSNYTAIEANLTGRTIQEVIDYMKKYNIPLPLENGLEQAIETYENQVTAKNNLLNAVTYRILSQGEPQLAAIRALIFAQEFHSDINIPAMYGIYPLSPNKDAFLERYLEAGGNPDLMCYKNYRLSLNNNTPASFTSPRQNMEQAKILKHTKTTS